MLPHRAKLRSSIVVLAAAAPVPRGASAQTSTVTCLPSFGWMNNTLGQDPCVVTSYLESVCGAFTVGPLPPNTYYGPPSAAGADSCTCNTVTYSMMAACSDCQNATYVSYPMDIPTGTKVPNWAYLNVGARLPVPIIVSGGFDPVAAQNNGDLPESTATNAQSTITVTYSTTFSASLTSSSTTSTGLSPTSTSSPTSPNVGVIAGGVGAILGAAIIGLVIWFFVRRRRSFTTPSAAFSDPGGGPGHTQKFYSTSANAFPMARQPRFYDPSDPATFPGRPHSFADPVTSSSSISKNPSMPSPVFPRQSRLGQYAGVPEL
ncbi:uncharacterized protein HD556DRAFT_1303775 [Suillus plorans]|uniref:Uncharacterized protein n=1 Tax=Suillus plorans TaxID=116603 RepID=A0A9P7J5F0_9AGAM|nr:uncharacterized protein HD556DRAFT_1303775 [Suillus plorans]KAG1803753.1 hypothetical protein HD556DRAFT_1303775 [Suillus plorans]